MSSHRIEHALIQQADQNPQRTAVVAGADSFTYVEVWQQARHMAARLQRAGITPGDRVAIYLDKTPTSVAALYGGWLAGAIVVPINATLRSPQVRHILSDSGAAVIVSRRSLLRRGARDAVSDITVVDVDDASHPGVDPSDASNASDALAVAQPDLSGGDTPAAILYTSGSTGQPKGILIAHDNLVAGARIVSTYLRIRADDRLLSVVPFNFDYGLNQLLVAFREGSALVLQRSTLPADICRTLVDAEVSVMAAVPPLWVQLMTERSPFSQTPFPKLRLLTSTGGVFPRALIEKYRRRLPDAELIIMYGLSEAFRSTYLPFDQIDARPGSMGHAIPETEIYVVDDDGRAVEAGEMGELVHAGPTVALGYWQNDQATEEKFRPHPFDPNAPRVVYSGDLVKADADGFFYFVSRRDAMLKTHGFRVSPEEVETALLASGLLEEVVVHGVPDPVAGQALVAHVVPNDPGAFAEKALFGYCRQHMPRYMIPARVIVHASLPRTSTGKIDRARVAEA